VAVQRCPSVNVNGGELKANTNSEEVIRHQSFSKLRAAVGQKSLEGISLSLVARNPVSAVSVFVYRQMATACLYGRTYLQSIY